MGIEGANRLINKIKAWVTAAISTHSAISNAHHDKYTDAEARASIDNIFDAGGHALKDIDFKAYRLKNVGVPLVPSDGDSRGAREDAISTHAALPSVHHTKYTSAEAIAAVLNDDKYIKNYEDDVTTGALTANGKLYTLSQGWFGDACTVTSSNRALNLVSSDACMRVWRKNDLAAADSAVEMITSNSGTDTPLHWWDFYQKKSNGDFIIRQRVYNNVWVSKNRLVIKGNSGYVGVNTTAPTAFLDVNSDIFRLRTAKTPATAGSAGNTGDICWDANYVYVCTAANTWKRSAIATW